MDEKSHFHSNYKWKSFHMVHMDENYIIKITRRSKKGQDLTPSPALSWFHNEPHELGLLPKPSKSKWIWGQWWWWLEHLISCSASLPISLPPTPQPPPNLLFALGWPYFLTTKLKQTIHVLILFQKFKCLKSLQN
jgi:hypothetical protein